MKKTNRLLAVLLCIALLVAAVPNFVMPTCADRKISRTLSTVTFSSDSPTTSYHDGSIENLIDGRTNTRANFKGNEVHFDYKFKREDASFRNAIVTKFKIFFAIDGGYSERIATGVEVYDAEDTLLASKSITHSMSNANVWIDIAFAKATETEVVKVVLKNNNSMICVGEVEVYENAYNIAVDDGDATVPAKINGDALSTYSGKGYDTGNATISTPIKTGYVFNGWTVQRRDKITTPYINNASRSDLRTKTSFTVQPAADRVLYLGNMSRTDNDTITLTANWVEQKYGDIDDNDAVNSIDSLYALRCATSKTTLTDLQKRVADVDGNNEVSAVDALYILNRSTCLIDKFPVEEYPEPVEKNYEFKDFISKEVLNNYLDRAITISCEGNELNLGTGGYIKDLILNTGAKYICRSATAWNPSVGEENRRPTQKAFIDEVHKTDPDVVFEACIFENVYKADVNQIAIPAYVFEAFGLTPETRNFSYDNMIFLNGFGRDQWGTDHSVPDITRIETQMFFYYRAVGYINAGFEALHMGQVLLIGSGDTNWTCYTKLNDMIRAYAKANARRGFVFLNAHTHGIIDNNGKLMFDFHMYPSRPKSDTTQQPHSPFDGSQNAYFEVGYSESIYRDSDGGVTYSGWSCESLPYLVELDNYGDDTANLNKPTVAGFHVWGMDEITWFANQNSTYRAEFLKYAYKWVTQVDNGLGHLAMPGLRGIRKYNAQGQGSYASYKASTGMGWNDEETIKAIWNEEQ